MAVLTEAEPAFVLHSFPYKEGSVIADYLTLNCGRLRAVVRGAQKASGTLKVGVRPFVPLLLDISASRSTLHTVLKVQVSGAPFLLPPPAVFAGMYVNELLFYLYRVQAGSPVLFAAYLQVLSALSASPEASPAPALRSFELTLLSELGFGFDFAQDSRGVPLRPELYYTFDRQQGFVPVEAWQTQQGTVRTQDMFSGAVLQAAGRLDFSSPQVLQAVRVLNKTLLTELLQDRTLHSRRLYRLYMQAQPKETRD